MSEACPGATGLEYATVFTAYAWIASYNHNLAYQVWARGSYPGKKGLTCSPHNARHCTEGVKYLKRPQAILISMEIEKMVIVQLFLDRINRIDMIVFFHPEL
ncbi:MAG: hypothetical protein JRJ77_18350 [Deltaproteobacteria bacterium]|nr:hypothetical protein [Deltaproteobacteria bacterium]